MHLTTQKRIASEILKCGITRVRIKEDKDVEEAITREDIRNLISKGLITKVQKKGTSRGKARQILKQKKRGRRRGDGSKKGRIVQKKGGWMILIRSQRKLLAELRDSKKITTNDYRTLYLRSKGGMFRNKKHLMSYIKERDILKIPVKGGKK